MYLSAALHKVYLYAPPSPQIHVSQNAADGNSPLSCSPDCPQGEGQGGATSAASAPVSGPRRKPASSGRSKNTRKRPNKTAPSAARKQVNKSKKLNNRKGAGTRPKKNKRNKPGSRPSRKKSGGKTKVTEKDRKRLGDAKGCPGSSLEKCVEGCPGKFGPKIFSACVKTCGKRC